MPGMYQIFAFIDANHSFCIFSVEFACLLLNNTNSPKKEGLYMQDCCSAPGLMPFEQAKASMLQSILSIQDQQLVSIEKSHGKVLSAPVNSPVNVPPADNSAMDGYAFCRDSLVTDQALILAGIAYAGQPFEGVCPAGHCIRIMTGAVLPKGCDTVVMQEQCTVENDNIYISGDHKVGSHIRRAGEDIKQGHAVFDKGRRISAVDVGVLSSLGIAEVSVFRDLKVALITTGDELKMPGQSLAAGDIFESNSQYLTAMLTTFGVDVINYGIIPDDKAAITDAFNDANENADVIISCGGVSVGDADYTKMVLERLGEIRFWKIAVKPGKPFAFGKLSKAYFFGLPGNPVSALVTAHQLVLPALAKMQDMQWQPALSLSATALDELKKAPGRLDFQRGIATTNDKGELEVRSTGKQGSGILTSMARANCYIVLPAEQGNVALGERVTVQLFDQFLF